MTKYSRYIFRGQNAEFSIETKEERIELNVCESFKYFSKNYCANILKKYSLLKKSSPWREPWWKFLFWAFLLNETPPHTKIRFYWALLLAFPFSFLFSFFVISDPFGKLFWPKNSIISSFWGHISVSNFTDSLLRRGVPKHDWVFLGRARGSLSYMVIFLTAPPSPCTVPKLA